MSMDEERHERPMSLYRTMQRVSELHNLTREARARRGSRKSDVLDSLQAANNDVSMSFELVSMFTCCKWIDSRHGSTGCGFQQRHPTLATETT